MLFKAHEFTLDNGLQCVIIENHKAPIVKHMVWYKSGSVQENAGKSGSAHLLEHLMFRGTKRLKDGQFNDIMNKNGVISNAFTSYDVTSYHEFSDVSRLEMIMALEADRMRFLSFDEKAFETEQKIVFQERKQVVENNPASPFNERLRLVLYGGTPYERPITGYNEDILAITYNDIMALYRRFYAPNNAIVVISGDVDVQTVRPLIEKYYGSLKAELIEKASPRRVVDKFNQKLEMSLKGVITPKFSTTFVLPSHQELGKKVYAFEVLADYLGYDENSVLYKKMVVEDKMASYVNTVYNHTTRGNTVFSVTMLPPNEYDALPENSLQELKQQMTAAVDALDEAKLAKTKRKMLSNLVYINDNPEDAAYWVGYALSVGISLDELQHYEDRIAAVSLEEVKDAYKDLLEAASVDGILLPLEAQK